MATNRFRIQEIHTYNFKGFPKFDYKFENLEMAILGGRNGYGKTTIFDAIELIFTGEIARMKSYCALNDLRLNCSKDKKPLVNNMDVPEVAVEIKIEATGKALWLKRHALVSDMKNPVDFTVFKELYFKYDNQDEYIIGSLSEIMPKYKSLTDNYNFIHYLDQEESNLFLKKKNKDRAKEINTLFDIENFDSDLKSIKEVVNALGVVKKKYISKLVQLDAQIKACRESIKIEVSSNVIYKKLFKYDLDWDKENPNPNTDFSSLISEGGKLDSLSYWLQHKQDYDNYQLASFISGYGAQGIGVNQVATFVFYGQNSQIIDLFRVYNSQILPVYGEINEQKLKTFSLPEEKLLPFISIEAINLIKQEVSRLLDFMCSCDQAQREYSKFIETRNSLLNQFNKKILKEADNCPLCGAKYETHQAMLDAISQQTEVFGKFAGDMASKLTKMIDEFRLSYQQKILVPIQKIIINYGLTTEIYSVVANPAIANYISQLDRFYKVKFLPAENYKETETCIQQQFDSIFKSYDKSLDYDRMKQILLLYPSDTLIDAISLKDFSIKKEYLRSIFMQTQSARLTVLLKEYKHTQDVLTALKVKSNSLDKLKKKIEDCKNAYLEKLISDIEILFYIYTGRILQDNFFGRGVFLKIDVNKRVLFISGDYNNDIDVLFNMSSGQLSAIIIAFTLALNKLYSDCAFLAIDDPVQTMDDMNVWGLIDTLRHEFRDTNILISTHESDFGSLMRYKAAKMGISAKYLDMAQIANR